MHALMESDGIGSERFRDKRQADDSVSKEWNYVL